MKTCKKCGEMKPVGEFHKQAAKTDGHQSYCKQCQSDVRASWNTMHTSRVRDVTHHWYEANRAACLERSRRNYEAKKERLREVRLRWRVANRERVKERAGEYYKTNRGRLRVAKAKWRASHLPLCNESTRRRRTRLRMSNPAGECSLTHAQWQDIKASYGFRCVYCGKKPTRLTQDHVVPVSRGGEHVIHNVVPACRQCNCSKHAGPPKPFQRAMVLELGAN